MSPLKANSEAAFQQQVLHLAAFYGWRAYHTHDSRRSQAGFPDLVLVRGPELIFAELKAAKTRVRPEQQAWIRDLQAVSAAVESARVEARPEWPEQPGMPIVDVYLWRPADFDDINARLSRARHRVEPLYRPPSGIPGQITIDEQIASTP